MKDITLVFPQWQGSIDNMSLYDGAYELADNIQGLPAISEIEVSPFKKLAISNSIAGKKDIFNQLNLACDAAKSANPDRILLLGGDCSTEIAPVTWLNEKYLDELALIWFDAHPDLNTPQTSKSGRMQGMALSAIMGNCGSEVVEAMCKPLLPRQVFCAGVRVFDPPELEFIARKKISFSAPESLKETLHGWENKSVKPDSKKYIYIWMLTRLAPWVSRTVNHLLLQDYSSLTYLQ